MSVRRQHVFVHPQMTYTPFQDDSCREWLSGRGIAFVSRPEEADWIVADARGALGRYAARFGARKRYLIWTHEPRWDTSLQPLGRLGTHAEARVMNVYTGDIYTDNLYYLHRWIAAGHVGRSNFTLSAEPALANRKVVVVASPGPRNPALVRDGVDVDLYRLRREIALRGHELGFVDIYGPGWPPGVSRGASRDGDWIAAKRSLIEGRYAFNLCFENTRAAYYCTEKIWDAIRMKCLPIYLGPPTIYETFPRGSFLDFGEDRSADALFEQVRSMSPAEYRQRYNRCVETLARCIPLAEASYRRTMRNILDALCIGTHARSF